MISFFCSNMDDSEFAELNSLSTAKNNNIEPSTFLPVTINLKNFREIANNGIIYLAGSDSDAKSYFSQQ